MLLPSADRAPDPRSASLGFACVREVRRLLHGIERPPQVIPPLREPVVVHLCCNVMVIVTINADVRAMSGCICACCLYNMVVSTSIMSLARLLREVGAFRIDTFRGGARRVGMVVRNMENNVTHLRLPIYQSCNPRSRYAITRSLPRAYIKHN